MELTQTKPNIHYFGLNNIAGVAVPFVGSMLLLIFTLEFSRGFLAILPFTAGVMGIAIVGLSHYSARRMLNRLQGKVDDKVLHRLLLAANSMATFGYVACLSAFSLAHNH